MCRPASRHLSRAGWAASRPSDRLAVAAQTDAGAVQLFTGGVIHQTPTGAKSLDHAFFRQLTGFYATAAVTEDRTCTVVAVDRRACVPLFYAQVGDLLVFAPEIKALLGWAEIRQEIDPGAVATFLVSGYLLGDQTLFRSVRRLRRGVAARTRRQGQPGTLLAIRSGIGRRRRQRGGVARGTDPAGPGVNGEKPGRRREDGDLFERRRRLARNPGRRARCRGRGWKPIARGIVGYLEGVRRFRRCGRGPNC